jgi:hypothetical protein
MHRRSAALTMACVCLLAALGGQAHSANPQSNVAIKATHGEESATGEKASSSKSGDRTSGVSIRHARLEKAEPPESTFATLSFDLYNEIDATVSDIAVSVAILASSVDREAPSPYVVRPFTIRLKEVVLAGYSVHYELRLRNLSSDCSCVPEIEVLEARVLANDSPH